MRSEKRLLSSVSMWSADLSALGASMRAMEPYADSFHFDLMDAHFTPNLLFGPDTIRSLRPLSKKPFEAHLMMTNPETMLAPLSEAGTNIIILQPETCDVAGLAVRIRALGCRPGIAISAAMPVPEVEEFLELLDIVVVMGTELGIKGAGLMPEALNKIACLRSIIDHKNLPLMIEADGGIRRHTVQQLYRAGADIIVPGSLAFGPDPKEVFEYLWSLRPSE